MLKMSVPVDIWKWVVPHRAHVKLQPQATYKNVIEVILDYDLNLKRSNREVFIV